MLKQTISILYGKGYTLPWEWYRCWQSQNDPPGLDRGKPLLAGPGSVLPYHMVLAYAI